MTVERNDIVYMMIVVGRKQAPPLLNVITEYGGRSIHTLYGKGTVKASYLQYALGMVPEKNKTVITCLLKKKKADDMLNMLINKFHFNKPNTGIAFTIPIETLSH